MSTNGRGSNEFLSLIVAVIVLTVFLWVVWEFVLKPHSLGTLTPWMLPWQ